MRVVIHDAFKKTGANPEVAAASSESQECDFRLLHEGPHLVYARAEERRYFRRRAVAQPKPDHLRRGAMHDAEPMKILVLRHKDKALRTRSRPDRAVSCTSQAEGEYIRRAFVEIGKVPGQARREILIE
jgi:hypothetical protein